MVGYVDSSEGLLFFSVISTKAAGRVEKSGRECALRQIRGQMSRLRFAPLDMTDSARFPPNRGQAKWRRAPKQLRADWPLPSTFVPSPIPAL